MVSITETINKQCHKFQMHREEVPGNRPHLCGSVRRSWGTDM